MLPRRLGFLELGLTFFFPALKIPRQSWRRPWSQREDESFRKPAIAFLTLFSCIYILHYFFIDVPARKEPLQLYANYRFGLAGLAIVAAALTTRTVGLGGLSLRTPTLVAAFNFSYWQAQSMTWRPDIPYGFSVYIPVIASIFLRLSPGGTLLFLFACYGSEYSAWAEKPTDLRFIFSAALVGFVSAVSFRSRMLSDVSAFLAEQEKIETQRILTEAQQELFDQVRSFLPKEVYRRVLEKMKNDRTTVLHAMDEVLRPKKQLVACIHGDIRGFTEKTKNVPGFSEGAVIPLQRAATNIVEEMRGIPRLVGDLIFAYFDLESPAESFRRALLCALEITAHNSKINLFTSESLRIRRPVILSFGEATVGNIGGLDGSRDITVLGSPANIVNRIDSITKLPQMLSILSETSVILTSSAGKVASQISPNVDLREIRLDELEIQVRDFSEEVAVYIVEANAKNIDYLRRLIDAQDRVLITPSEVRAA